MKKAIALIISCLLVICSVALPAFAATKYTVTIDMNFVGNLIFSRYDVDMYINSQKIDTIPHGQDYKASFSMEAGNYKIVFTNMVTDQ